MTVDLLEFQGGIDLPVGALQTVGVFNLIDDVGRAVARVERQPQYKLGRDRKAVVATKVARIAGCSQQ